MRRGLLALAALAAAVAVAWWLSRPEPLPDGFAIGNGRLEAEEVQIATKYPGRLAEVLADEGDDVQAGQVLARMDTAALETQLAEARARLAAAQTGLDTARALRTQRESECALAEKELARALALHDRNVASQRDLDVQQTRVETARAACSAAEAQVVEAEAAIRAGAAAVARIQTELHESVLFAPVSGRIQHRLARPGEVLPAGGRVLTLLDLDRVDMQVFLPAEAAGRVRIGSEARIVLDALPERPLPARVRFVADEAQFTPKQVETRSEREKLSFRVKVRVLDGRDPQLKPGAPGVAWVRLDEDAPWPAPLR